MSISDFSRVILAYSHAETVQSILYRGGDNAGHSALNYLFSEEGLEERQVGEVILVPTYRLEEVEEIVEPEKPRVPVEPYVGLTFKSYGVVHTIIGQTSSGHWVLAYFDGEIRANGLITGHFSTEDFAWVAGYPCTPSTPAVTRRQKKWVKIDHPEVPSDGIA